MYLHLHISLHFYMRKKTSLHNSIHMSLLVETARKIQSILCIHPLFNIISFLNILLDVYTGII